MRNVIIFDIVGVLRIYNNDSFNDWLKTTFHISNDIKPIWKKWQDLRDIDELNEHEFYSNFLKDVAISESKLPEELFYKKFFEDCVRDDEKILKFIEYNLYGKYRLYIFSNFSRIDLKKYREKFDFEKFFDKCVYSCDIKVKKPNIEFFEKGLKIIDHNGNECIFFDDQLKSKTNSEKVGIKFIQYLNYDQFIKDLDVLETK